MYLYLYDELAQERKHRREIFKIERRLCDLGITGVVERIGVFKPALQAIRREAKKGLSTIVVVGSDETIQEALNADLPSVVFGFIPLESHSRLAHLFDLPFGSAACDVLSARTVRTIDAGVLNGRRFIMGVTIPRVRAEILCEDRYRVRTEGEEQIDVFNLSSSKSGSVSVGDGFVDAIVRTYRRRWIFFRSEQRESSRFRLRSLTVTVPAPVGAFVDGALLEASEFRFSVAPHALRMIAGRAKAF
ncbi:MAG TPA: hypothetical protein VJB99_03625 [Patescibacteria group bacterium]|nr:hypothetical protein [Patescibacteria group bacterium]